MNEINTLKRIERLHIERKKILSMSPKKALDHILDAKHPAALVHSFPEEDFYFFMHDLGVADSLELLSLASDKQWEYIVDVEVWHKDHIELNQMTHWLSILCQADPDRFLRWFLKHKTEFVEYYLFKNIEVIVRGHDEDPSDIGDDYFTYDDVFYVKFKNNNFEYHLSDQKLSEDCNEQRDLFLHNFLLRLSSYNYNAYRNVLVESTSILSAETEESEYRWRNVRLAEKGFVPFEEALGIYQSMEPSEFYRQSKKQFVRVTSDFSESFALPIPHYKTNMLNSGNVFVDSLMYIESDDFIRQIQMEFAGLCNQVISADQDVVRSKEKLKSVIKKVCGYLSVGLECLITEKQDDSLNVVAAIIKKYPLSQIFRVGYGSALKLNWKAKRWLKKSWFAENKLPLNFFGEIWMGALGGILLNKPLFFDNYQTGVLYREFRSIDDIRQTEKIFNKIAAIDDIFRLIDTKLDLLNNEMLNYKNYVLTLWVKYYLGYKEDLEPIDLNDFKRFYQDLWQSKKNTPYKIKNIMKESFLSWLACRTGMTIYDVTQKAGKILEELFAEIESEYCEVSVKYLDAKYIHLFLVS